jgi:outer membrane protein OmpA-like peptidoglycan-associated protein
MKLSALFPNAVRILCVFILFVSSYSFSQEPDTLRFYFDVDEHSEFDLSADDHARLKSLFSQTRIVAIEAHCDFRGSVEYNLNLAQKRLNRVEKHLLDAGFSTSLSNNSALGEARAESSGLSLEKCRRVDILFIEPAIQNEGISENTEIESRSPVRPGYAPEPIYSEPVANEQLSKSAIEEFMENEEEDEMQFDLTILFVNVSTRVLEESEPQLEELLEIMQNNPTLNATFHGHVCCAPYPELAEGRARSVAVFLRENDIPADRLDFVGHSNTQPKVWPENTDDDRKQNRRVSVTFIKSK